ncbi:MAG: hypothetical protein JRC68_10085 [Deltaproteobacteria bacterium]|nr:hypothetical protein [Deltaproteobacteria bacterium]
MGSVAGSKGAFVGDARDVVRLKKIRRESPFAFPLQEEKTCFNLNLGKDVGEKETCGSSNKRCPETSNSE